MELVIYSGIGELPSIDYDCLRVTVRGFNIVKTLC